MNFDWDEHKARSNLAKHGVSFQTATVVFDDPNALVDIDDSDPADERWRIIAIAAADVLLVVYAERDGDVIRIISARKATRHEQDRYYRQASP